MMEMDIGQLVTSLIEKVGIIQGRQESIIWVLGGAGVLITGGVVYLGRCVFNLAWEISRLTERLDRT